MKSGLISVSDLFDGTKKFHVPKYQRSYAWEEVNWLDFIEDLINHPKNHKYFYGTILLKDSGRDGDFEVFEVVDGQQRITTLTILINLIINKLSTLNSTCDLSIKKEKYLLYHEIHKLKLGNEGDNEFLQTYVLNDGIPTSYSTPAQRLLFDAKGFFKEKLDNVEGTILEEILGIIENADILVYSVKESAEASLIFEISNDRGRGLTNLEKIKSFLMYKAYLSSGEKAIDVIDNIFVRFGDIYKVLEKTKMIISERDLKNVDEDRLCQYHFIGLYMDNEVGWNYKYQYQNYIEFLKKHVNSFIQSNSDVLIDFIDKYTVSLRDTFNSFENVISQKNKHLDEIIYLRRIAVFYPLLLKSYQLDTTDNKVFFSQLLEVLSVFSFRVFGMGFARTSDVDLTINKLCRDFKGDFTIIIQNLKEKINKWAPMADFIARLRSPNFYNISTYKNTPNFLYWKYENYLRTNFQPVCGEMPFEEFNDSSGKYKISIEHITAQTPKNGLQFCEIDEEFEENYLHSIGNLTIDPQSSNSSKGNEIWENKNEKYFQKAPFKTQLELSDFVDDQTKQWDRVCIEKRRDKIIDIAKKLWTI